MSFSVPVAGMYVYRAVKQVPLGVELGHTNGDSMGIEATEYDTCSSENDTHTHSYIYTYIYTCLIIYIMIFYM